MYIILIYLHLVHGICAQECQDVCFSCGFRVPQSFFQNLHRGEANPRTNHQPIGICQKQKWGFPLMMDNDGWYIYIYKYPLGSCQTPLADGEILTNIRNRAKSCSSKALWVFTLLNGRRRSWAGQMVSQSLHSWTTHWAKFDAFWGRFGKWPFPQWIQYKHTLTCMYTYIYIFIYILMYIWDHIQVPL